MMANITVLGDSYTQAVPGEEKEIAVSLDMSCTFVTGYRAAVHLWQYYQIEYIIYLTVSMCICNDNLKGFKFHFILRYLFRYRLFIRWNQALPFTVYFVSS